MKNTAVLTALVVLALAACDKKPAEEPFVPDPVTPSSGGLPTGHPPINNGPANALAEASDVLQSQQGTVVSVINIPQFTYLEIKDDKGTRWIAASTIDAKKGDVVKFDQGSTMNNFNSKTLNRTFASITFVNRVSVVNAK
jgi:hypothetical protein